MKELEAESVGSWLCFWIFPFCAGFKHRIAFYMYYSVSLFWICFIFWLLKLDVSVFKAPNGLAPLYVTEILIFQKQSRTLKSSSQLLPEVSGSRYKRWCDRTFSAAEQRLWNKLPPDIRTPSPNLFRMVFYCLAVLWHFTPLYLSFMYILMCFYCMYVLFLQSYLLDSTVKCFGHFLFVVKGYKIKCWLIDWLIDCFQWIQSG